MQSDIAIWEILGFVNVAAAWRIKVEIAVVYVIRWDVRDECCGILKNDDCWNAKVKIAAEIKMKSNAAGYVTCWGVGVCGCWNALWDAEMGVGENISNAEMFVKQNEMLTIDCCCWDDEGCIGSIEISEIIEKDNTGLNICCEIAAEDAVKCAVTDADAGSNAGSDLSANVNVDLIDADADAGANAGSIDAGVGGNAKNAAENAVENAAKKNFWNFNVAARVAVRVVRFFRFFFSFSIHLIFGDVKCSSSSHFRSSFFDHIVCSPFCNTLYNVVVINVFVFFSTQIPRCFRKSRSSRICWLLINLKSFSM